jgi:hypothetical protein
VFIPITRRPAAKSGPPESPGWSSASVLINPVSRARPPWSSPTVIERPTPVMWPAVVTSVPVPPALPTAVAVWPTLTFDESPTDTVCRPLALWSFRSATSAEML